MPKHRIVTSHAAHSTARQDPYFVETVADLLIFNAGERVNLTELTGADSQVVGEAIRLLRRLGFAIEAQQGKAGYTLTGWSREGTRWLHVDRVFDENLVLMGRRVHGRRVGPTQGQLEMEG